MLRLVSSLVLMTVVAVGAVYAKDTTTKKMSPKDQAAIEMRFQQWDVNNNGVLTLKEFTATTTNPKQVATLEQLFWDMDINHNGSVSVGEYKNYWTRKSVSERYTEKNRAHNGKLTFNEFKGTKANPKAIAQIEKLFQQMDANHDGYVSIDEYAACWVNRLVATWFNHTSASQTGNLRWEQYKVRETNPTVVTTIEKTFQEIDANHDGYITAEEYASYLAKQSNKQ